MLKFQPVLSVLSALALIAAPTLAAQRTQQTPGAQPPQAASPNFVTCSPYIELMFANHGLIVGCTDDKTPSNTYSFQVVPGDSPSIEQVIAFVQPYAMAVKTVQVMQNVGVGSKSPIQNFSQRIGFYLANGKITGMHMVTAN